VGLARLSEQRCRPRARDARNVAHPPATKHAHGGLGPAGLGLYRDDRGYAAGIRKPTASGLRSPHTQRELTRPKRIEAFNRLTLSPRTLLGQPSKFARDFWLGLQHQPRMLVTYMLHGGRWRNRPRLDLSRWVADRLQECALPPSVPLGAPGIGP